MKIVVRIKRGKLKGWTIRKSKNGWYDLYSDRGISQSIRRLTISEVKDLIKTKS